MTKAGMIFGSIAIAALIGVVAVTVANGSFTALLSSIVARPSDDRTQAPITSAAPVQQPEVKQSGAIEPAPAPAQLPAPAPSAPLSNESTSVARTAPVLDNAGSVPPAQQAGGGVTEAEILVPDAEQRRTPLTAAEKAAVARGLKELEITAANTPFRPAPNRFALTQAEKASVERGLRELEKERAKQLSQR